LLIAVDEKTIDEVKEIFKSNNLQTFIEPIGRCVKKREKMVYVK
jgi:hypothetical protein